MKLLCSRKYQGDSTFVEVKRSAYIRVGRPPEPQERPPPSTPTGSTNAAADSAEGAPHLDIHLEHALTKHFKLTREYANIYIYRKLHMNI